MTDFPTDFADVAKIKMQQKKNVLSEIKNLECYIKNKIFYKIYKNKIKMFYKKELNGCLESF